MSQQPSEQNFLPTARRDFLKGVAGSAVGLPVLPELLSSVQSHSKTANELCFKDAVELARMIRQKQTSATEVMTAFLAQINRVNPKVNAICTFIREEAAMRAAKEAD